MGDPCPLSSPPRGFHMDSLRLKVLTPHHATTGCKCRECFGLAEFMASATGNTHGLPPTEPALNAHAVVLLASEACTGGLTCECADCVSDRLRAIERQRTHRPSQPWEAKAA